MRVFSVTVRGAEMALLTCALSLAIAPYHGISSGSPSAQHRKVKLTEASSDHPAWRIDLHAMGYPANDSRLQLRRGLHEFDTVDFVSEGVVAATFMTQEFVPVLQRRENSNRMRPYHLHAVFLDAANGRLLNTLEWPTDDPSAGIFPRYDGSFLFFSTEHIILYSPDWRIVKELSLPGLKVPHSYLAGIAQSPSGNILEIHSVQNGLSRCSRILTATLDGFEDSCDLADMFTISDKEIAMHEGTGGRTEDIIIGPGFHAISGSAGPAGPTIRSAGASLGNEASVRKIFIRAPGAPARTLCDTSWVAGCSMPQFLSDDRIVVYGPFAVEVLDGKGASGGGRIDFETKLDGSADMIDTMGRPVRPSANGKRFAVVINATRWHSGDVVHLTMSPGDMPGPGPNHVDVYDAESSQWIYRLANKNEQLKEIWGLGLSPSGEKLVIDSGGVIQMYRLPPAAEITDSKH
jgi:hypothetical protein